MKIPSTIELQQIAVNHSWDIDFKDFMSFNKKCTAKPFSFFLLVSDTTVVWSRHLGFRCNILKIIYKLIMTLVIRLEVKKYNMILIKKQQKYQHCH